MDVTIWMILLIFKSFDWFLGHGMRKRISNCPLVILTTSLTLFRRITRNRVRVPQKYRNGQKNIYWLQQRQWSSPSLSPLSSSEQYRSPMVLWLLFPVKFFLLSSFCSASLDNSSDKHLILLAGYSNLFKFLAKEDIVIIKLILSLIHLCVVTFSA